MAVKPSDLNIVVSEGGKVPTRGTDGAAGYDLYSPIDFTIPASQNVRGTAAVAIGKYQVDIKVAFAIPAGVEGQIRPRSGLAFNSDVIPFQGTIDSDFRGTVKVLLYNLSGRAVEIKKGDRIAQIVFGPAFTPNLKEVDKLDETERGEGGLGHTGK